MKKIKDIINVEFSNEKIEKINELLEKGYILGPIHYHVWSGGGYVSSVRSDLMACMVLWEDDEGILGVIRPSSFENMCEKEYPVPVVHIKLENEVHELEINVNHEK